MDYMQNGFKIGRLFGIDIFIDYSWLIIFFLITWLFSTSFFPTFFPEFSSSVNIALGISTSILFFLSALAHEFMHSLVAKANKIEVKKITLFLFGGVSEIFEEPDTAKTEFKIAVAGPLASFFLAGLFWLLSLLFSYQIVIEEAFAVSSTLARANLVLGIFNLLPGFPLDGGRIFRSIIWYFSKDLMESTKIASSAGKFIAFLIIMLGIFEIFAFGFWGGIWLILIGIFLLQAASQSYLELLISEKLKNKKALNFAVDNYPLIRSNESIDRVIDNYFIHKNYDRLPVINDSEQIIGSITIKDIRKSTNEETTVQNIMRPYPERLKISKDDDASKALRLMIRTDETFIPIKENKKTSSIVTLESIAKYLSDKKII